MSKPTKLQTDTYVDAILMHINHSLKLQSILYDFDLMPEQLKKGTRDWHIMLMISHLHMSNRDKNAAE